MSDLGTPCDCDKCAGPVRQKRIAELEAENARLAADIEAGIVLQGEAIALQCNQLERERDEARARLDAEEEHHAEHHDREIELLARLEKAEARVCEDPQQEGQPQTLLKLQAQVEAMRAALKRVNAEAAEHDESCIYDAEHAPDRCNCWLDAVREALAATEVKP